MIFKPHEYQQHCINKILEIKKLGLYLDMGLGKTVTTLTAIRELKYNRFLVRKVLIIAPKKVAEGTWTKEKDKWDHTKFFRVSQVLGSQAPVHHPRMGWRIYGRRCSFWMGDSGWERSILASGNGISSRTSEGLTAWCTATRPNQGASRVSLTEYQTFVSA